MPIQNITSAIERSLSAMSATRPNWQSDPKLWSVIDLEYFQPVSQALEIWPTPKALRGTTVTDGFGFGFAFDVNRLAQWVVYRSGRVGVAEALQDVERFVSCDAPEMLTVFAIGGVSPASVVQLDTDMTLMPIASLPPSQQRNEALGLIPAVALQMQPLRLRPTAAITLKYKLALAVSPVDRLSKDWAEARTDRDTRLTEAQLCMGVACRGVIDLVAAWSQPADESTPAIFSTGAMSVHVSAAPRRIPKEVDYAKVCQTLSLFSKFRGDRQTLHVPLERLNSTMAQFRIVDRAIDLGIALESLLMHERRNSQSSGNQEPRFKIGVRGAWLGGGTLEERRARFGSLQKLYDLRSVAVHSGRITRGDSIKLMEQLEAGENLCADLIQKVLEMGQWPDWNKLVLGDLEI